MMAIKAYDEKSVSRSGLHKRRRLYLIMGPDCERLEPRVASKERLRPLYAKGYSVAEYVEVPEGSYLVQVDLTMNPRGRVRGVVTVLDHRGEKVCEALYRKLKVWVRYCIPEAEKVLVCALHALNMPVKKYGGPGHKGSHG